MHFGFTVMAHVIHIPQGKLQFLLWFCIFLCFFSSFLDAEIAWNGIFIKSLLRHDFFKASTPEFTIIVFGWRRTASLTRLLDSLLAADYAGHKVNLHFRIDGDSLIEVIDIATQFNWPHGPKFIAINPKRVGLANV